MIDARLARWATSLTDADLRIAYVEALEWLYEDGNQLHLLMLEGLAESGRQGTPTNLDDMAAHIMAECAGRWVYSHDGAVASEPC